MFQRFTKSRSLLIEINPHQVLVAGITRQRQGPVTIDFAAEFDRGNDAALRLWIEGKKDARKKWMAAVCGFIAQKGILQRETLRGTDLSDPGGLIASIRDRQTLRFSVSSAPFQHVSPDQWTFRAVNALDGTPLPEGDVTRPALLLGLANEELHEIQQHLLDCQLMPQQLEPALLPLFGSIYQIMERRHQPRAAVVFVIKPDSTAIYILGKEGVHTPGQVNHGLTVLVQHVRKEFALESDAAALQRLMNPDDLLRKRAPRLLRHLGAELRPVINSYEMTTGQPAGEIYCAYLPPALAWIAEPLVKAMDHELMTISCQEWMPTVGLAAAEGLPSLGPHWLGALSLAANLPEAVGPKTEITQAKSEEFNRPWHLDCRLSIEPTGTQLVGRQFLATAGAVALMLFALTVTGWQWYVTRSLQADTAYWQAQMASNQKLVDELSATLNDLNTRTTRLNHAHGLMRESEQATEFLMNLGRTLPPRLRLDRIEANENRVLLTGSLLEPAEDASRSLGRYLDTLRRTPQIGELFSTISATSLQREGDADSLMFEVTMRRKSP
jgi:Tfp pilus assembly protein PilN